MYTTAYTYIHRYVYTCIYSLVHMCLHTSRHVWPTLYTTTQRSIVSQLFPLQLIVHHHRHHHLHHDVPLARISLNLSRHFSLSFIASCRSSGLHPVSSHSCCPYVRAGCPAFARPYMGAHWSKSLMSPSLLLQQCPACLVHLTWIVFVIGGMWQYSCYFVGCCRQDLFNIAHSILV